MAGGNLSEGGSLLWNFEQKGRIEIRSGKMQEGEKYGEGDKFVPINREEVMMSLMDIAGVLDIQEVDGDLLVLFTDPKDLVSVKKSVDSLGYVVNSYELIRIAKVLKDVEPSAKEKVLALVENLEEYSDVQGVWFDAKF